MCAIKQLFACQMMTIARAANWHLGRNTLMRETLCPYVFGLWLAGISLTCLITGTSGELAALRRPCQKIIVNRSLSQNGDTTGYSSRWVYLFTMHMAVCLYSVRISSETFRETNWNLGKITFFGIKKKTQQTQRCHGLKVSLNYVRATIHFLLIFWYVWEVRKEDWLYK